ncbi:hypothetical protein [Nocardioides alcanivorans]|uniref:hypothetical protein n=1 Tax=Nocardioides alcanivorans TaxID=2897352 RepID=UPI001F175C6F|nr:hypothetical protein [Nocardioides alcanivorans]
METLSIPSRFRGPDRSGNGGWSAGALAAFLAPNEPGHLPPVQVTLRMPPALERPLAVRCEGDRAELWDADQLVASAVLVSEDEAPVPVADVPLEEARAARESFAGMAHHPFPHCFACGTAREEGDGLRLFAGAVEPYDATARVATTWTPHPSMAAADDPERVTLPVAWAALDCPGAWTVDLAERAIVLGRITGCVDTLPRIGEEHVVMGGLLGHEGRKWFTATTILDSDRRVVARARHTWIEVDPSAFND